MDRATTCDLPINDRNTSTSDDYDSEGDKEMDSKDPTYKPENDKCCGNSDEDDVGHMEVEM